VLCTFSHVSFASYINAASTKQEPQLLRLLVAIRQETLTAVSRQLPAEVRARLAQALLVLRGLTRAHRTSSCRSWTR